ncbi:hypothetical protein D5085_14665 [Ectothiorhodospiraceae bacterium BW-2]|nr:hypothetical protein D5085_14665 [Ectothiorhodospiraceae bacterium BW-2]
MKPIVIALLLGGMQSVSAVEVAARLTDREIIESLGDLKSDIAVVHQRIDAVNQRFDAVNQRFDAVNQRFDAVNQRFDAMEKQTAERFDAMEKQTAERFDAMEKQTAERFDAMEKQTNARFDAVNQRIDSLEKQTAERFDAMEKQTNARFDAVNQRFDQMDGQLDKIWNLMLVMIAGIFGLIGFIVWDRKTALRPLEQRLDRIELELQQDFEIQHQQGSKMARLVGALKELAQSDPKLQGVLRSFSLL